MKIVNNFQLGIAKFLRTLLLGILVSANGAAFADISAIRDVNEKITVLLSSQHLDYKEYQGGEISNSEKGALPGIEIYVPLVKNYMFDHEYLKLNLSGYKGQTDYVGQYMVGGSGYGSVRTKDNARITNYGLKYQKGFEIGSQTLVSPYFEVSSRNWLRGLNTYDETYQHSYYGLGLVGQVALTNYLVVSMDALYGKTFNSRIEARGAVNFSAPLGNSSYSKLGLGANYLFTKYLFGQIEVSKINFDYGQSIPNNGFYEPDSTTKSTFYKLGIGLRF